MLKIKTAIFAAKNIYKHTGNLLALHIGSARLHILDNHIVDKDIMYNKYKSS